MKIKSIPTWFHVFCISSLTAAALFGIAITSPSQNSWWIYFGNFLPFIGILVLYLVILSISFIYVIDTHGIHLKRWGRELFFLPWEQVRSVVSAPTTNGDVLFISRVDLEQTKQLLDESAVVTSNGQKRYSLGSIDITTAAMLVLSRKQADSRPLMKIEQGVRNNMVTRQNFVTIRGVQMQWATLYGGNVAEFCIM